jgi:alanine racemase
MNRYGCDLSELNTILSIVKAENVVGVYTHLYCADNDGESERQLNLFLPAVKAVKKVNKNAVAHISASGGILRGGKFLLDGARSGIMLYGYLPEGFRIFGLKPAMSVYAPLSQETKPVGGGVGYNVADKNYSKLCTYRLGYADGFARTASLGEKTLCMDAFIADESRSMGDISGAITFNGQKFVKVFSDAEAYAKRLNTISYEVLCSVSKRSLRIYER